MHNQRNSFLLLAFPLTVFILLGLVLYVERTGVIYSQKSVTLDFLAKNAVPKPSNYTDSAPECLILFNSKDPSWKVFYQVVHDTMNEMRVRCNSVDANPATASAPEAYTLSDYKTVVVTFHDLSSEKQFDELMNWAAGGGQVLFTQPQKPTAVFLKHTNELGIKSVNDQLIKVFGVKFITDLMPGGKDLIIAANDNFLHYSLPVVLKSDSLVHLTSSDDYQLPLLWQANSGQGKIVYINSNAFHNKNSRGIIAAAYSLLQKAFVYPVINSSLYFIDDFPAPIPDGQDPEFRKEYNLDNRGFFEKVWWPEIYALAKDYGLKFTGGLIETYSYTTKPPLEQSSYLDDFRWMGGYLLKDGGELALHGYNHLPLCLASDGFNQFIGLPSWPSVSAMETAVKELDNFGRLLFPGRTFSVYVPPSNILCPEMRSNLPKTLPELKVISSLYLQGEADSNADPSYVQEFSIASDGIIELPRISSGYVLSDYWKYVVVSETTLHYIQSHFIYPDNVQDTIRSQNRTWKELRSGFEKDIQWKINSTPGMRQMTAIEGGAAVQRYYQLKVSSKFADENTQLISLGNYYDEAWLMLRSSRKPSKIEGGTITQVTSTLFLINASGPEITIHY